MLKCYTLHKSTKYVHNDYKVLQGAERSRLVLEAKPPLDLTVVNYLLIATKRKKEPHKVNEITQKDKEKGVMNGLSHS